MFKVQICRTSQVQTALVKNRSTPIHNIVTVIRSTKKKRVFLVRSAERFRGIENGLDRRQRGSNGHGPMSV